MHAIPLALFAGLGHLWIGNVDFGLLGNLLLPVDPRRVAGCHVVSAPAHGPLRAALAVVLLAIGFRLW